MPDLAYVFYCADIIDCNVHRALSYTNFLVKWMVRIYQIHIIKDIMLVGLAALR